MPVGDSPADVHEALRRVQRLAHAGRVENDPGRARRSGRGAHGAQERPAEPAPLKLRPHLLSHSATVAAPRRSYRPAGAVTLLGLGKTKIQEAP
jgi:hypothetical protein